MTRSEEHPPRVESWPAAWIKAFEERAAIRQFDGGLSRPDAERAAEASTRREAARAQGTGAAESQPDSRGAGTRQNPRGGGET